MEEMPKLGMLFVRHDHGVGITKSLDHAPPLALPAYILFLFFIKIFSYFLEIDRTFLVQHVSPRLRKIFFRFEQNTNYDSKNNFCLHNLIHLHETIRSFFIFLILLMSRKLSTHRFLSAIRSRTV